MPLAFGIFNLFFAARAGTLTLSRAIERRKGVRKTIATHVKACESHSRDQSSVFEKSPGGHRVDARRNYGVLTDRLDTRQAHEPPERGRRLKSRGLSGRRRPRLRPGDARDCRGGPVAIRAWVFTLRRRGGVSRARSAARAFFRLPSMFTVSGCAPPSTRRAVCAVSSNVVTAWRSSWSP